MSWVSSLAMSVVDCSRAKPSIAARRPVAGVPEEHRRPSPATARSTGCRAPSARSGSARRRPAPGRSPWRSRSNRSAYSMPFSSIETPVKVPAALPSLVTPTGEKVEESWLRCCGPPVGRADADGDRLVAEVERHVAGRRVVGGRRAVPSGRGLVTLSQAAGVRRRVAEDELVAAGRQARGLVDDVSVQVLLRGSPTAGTVGVKLAVSVCERAEVVEILDRHRPRGRRSAPASVSVAGRLALSAIVEVGCTATDERLTCTGSRPGGAVARLRRRRRRWRPPASPSAPAPTACVDSPLASGRNEPGRRQHERQVAAGRLPDRGERA